jgi:hypothetical protein
MPEAENSTSESQKILETMATPDFTNELTALMKIRAPVVFLTCREEKRMLKYLQYLVVTRGFRASTWDCYTGMSNLLTGELDKTVSDDVLDPDMALHYIIQDAKSDSQKSDGYESQSINGKIYVMLDFYNFLDNPDTERRIKTFAQIDSMTMIIITGHSLSIPPGLNNLFSVLDFPYPNKNEIKGTVKSLLNAVGKESVKFEKSLMKQFKDNEHEIIGSVNGLTLTEAQKALSKSVVVHRGFDTNAILGEKKQYIRQRGTLEFYEPDLTMDDVGGLANMRSWLERRKAVFDPKAREFGLPALKGILAVGVPGGGKSLIAKASAAFYGIPLLKLDFGTLFRSHVGESEETTRAAIQLAEALAPCVSFETEIKTCDGSIIVGKEFNQTNNKFNISVGTDIAVLDDPIDIPSFDMEKDEIVNSKLKAIIRRKVRTGKKVYKVTLSNGSTIKVSEDHKFLVLNNDKKEWKKMKDISEKDKIITL